MRSENLVLFERARRVRYRAALCRELIALCRNEKAIAELEILAREFEARASELERKARQAANIRRVPQASAMESARPESLAVQEPLPPGDDDDSEKPR